MTYFSVYLCNIYNHKIRFMAQYETIKVVNRTHIIKEDFRKDMCFPDPNYQGTGKALVGVCRVGETLDEWVKRRRG